MLHWNMSYQGDGKKLTTKYKENKLLDRQEAANEESQTIRCYSLHWKRVLLE